MAHLPLTTKDACPQNQSVYRYIRLAGCMVAVPLLALLITTAVSPAAHAQVGGTQKVWVQVMDSCQQAISGATFQLAGSNIAAVQGPVAGPHTIASAHGQCPLQRGNCATVQYGCQSWTVALPATGTASYTIRELASPNTYVPCTGGSVCTGGPESVSFTIDSTGKVSATVHNVYPDGLSVTWPTSGAPYAGTLADPIVFHNFGLGPISCDGDGDADDHLTGSPGSHCDSIQEPGGFDRGASHKGATAKPVVKKPVTSKPVVKKPVTPKPVVKKPVTPKPVASRPVTPRPVTPRPVVKRPVASRPVMPRPVTSRLTTTRPVTTPKTVTTPKPARPVAAAPRPAAPNPVALPLH